MHCNRLRAGVMTTCVCIWTWMRVTCWRRPRRLATSCAETSRRCRWSSSTRLVRRLRCDFTRTPCEATAPASVASTVSSTEVGQPVFHLLHLLIQNFVIGRQKRKGGIWGGAGFSLLFCPKILDFYAEIMHFCANFSFGYKSHKL